MRADLPKIWNTPFPVRSANVKRLDFRLSDNSIASRVKTSNAFHYPDGTPLLPEQFPDYLFFDATDLSEKYRSGLPDWVRITDGLYVISEKFRDLLLNFDMGTNQMVEVPLYEFDQKTRRAGRYFILHVSATKDTLIAEKSVGLETTGKVGNWRATNLVEDVLAVRASAADGADLWIDPHMKSRIFLTDRLKSALKPAGIRVIDLPLRPSVVVA